MRNWLTTLTGCNFLTQLIMGPLGQGLGRVYLDAVSKNDFYGFVREIVTIDKYVKKIFLVLFGVSLILGILFFDAKLLLCLRCC